MPTCQMIDREMCVLGTSQWDLQLLDVGVKSERTRRFPGQSMKLCPTHILDNVFSIFVSVFDIALLLS